MSELSCVCPRCGTPFIYTVTADKTVDEVSEENSITPLVSPAHSSSDEETRSVSSSVGRLNGDAPSFSPSSSTEDITSHLVEEKVRMRPTIGQEQRVKPGRRRFTCLKSCLLIVLACFVITVLLARACTHSYTAANLDEHQEAAGKVQPDTGSEAVVDEGVPSDIHPEKAPDWVQGSWVVETDEGTISLTLRGNGIAETVDGKTRSGTYSYAKGILRFNDGHGNLTYYPLDTIHHQIDAGNGRMMHRVE